MLNLQQTWPYHRIGAWTFVLLFTAFWSLKTTHVLVSHHHDGSEHPVCEAAHDPNSAHIHDERWATEDCTLCAFVVSVSEPFFLLKLPAFFAKLPESQTPVFYHAPVFSKKISDSSMRRGPPHCLIGRSLICLPLNVLLVCC
ncbi:MAG: hypothetical protein ACKVT2_17065 [Saprospiraceae bacterium]